MRKFTFLNEREKRGPEDREIWARAAVVVVLRNQWQDDSEASIMAAAEYAKDLGAQLTPRLVEALDAPVITYGKGVVLGGNVSPVLGAAMMHNRIGKPIRLAVGGGAAVIPSNIKRGGFGTVLDIPLGHKDDPWQFAYADTMSMSLPDAPNPDEFLLCIAVGGRSSDRGLFEEAAARVAR